MNYKKIIEACSFLLHNYPNAQEHLEYLKNRLAVESINKFEFGFFPPLSEINALSSIVGEDLLIEQKLLFSKLIEDSISPRLSKISYFENYPIIMPFKDVYGEPIAIVARTIIPESSRKIPKYKNTSFKKGNHVFGLFENKSAIIKKDFVYVVEGQFDLIKASEKGLDNVVAIGSSNMSAYQLSLISRYTNNIFIVFDNDEAGEKGRNYISKKFSNFVNIRNFYLPDIYNDIDDFFQTNSLDDLEFTIKEI